MQQKNGSISAAANDETGMKLGEQLTNITSRNFSTSNGALFLSSKEKS